MRTQVRQCAVASVAGCAGNGAARSLESMARADWLGDTMAMVSLDRPLLPALVSGLLALPACSDPSVAVRFEIPAHYRGEVAEISLQLLVPPVAEPFTCDELAFQDVPEIAVVASRAQEVRTRQGDRLDLRGIPRLGPKLFYVRGLDREGVAIVAACGEVGDIEDDVTVTLAGEPVVVVSTPSLAPGMPLPERVTVTLTDTLGELMPNVEVRWLVTAPGGPRPPEQERTVSGGRLDIHPPTDLLPGPVALDISARWQRSQPPGLIGFTEAPIMFQDTLPGDPPEVGVGRTEALYQVGNIGPNGETGFVGLGPARSTGEGRQVFLAYRPEMPIDAPFHLAASDPLLNVHAVGLADGGARDRVVAINGVQLIEISPVDGSTTTTLLTPTPGSVATRILPAGRCGPNAPGNDYLLVAFANETVAVYRATGEAVAGALDEPPPTPRPIASGCVDDVGKEPHRTVVFASEGFQQHLLSLDVNGADATGLWPTYAAGVGFLPAIEPTDPSLLLGASITNEGNAIARYQLVVVDQQRLDLELTTQDDSATLFWSAQGGDLDGDRRADVTALLDFGTTDGLTEFRILVSLGVEHHGQRVVGISPPYTALSPRLFTADFDYDGHDDVLIATPTTTTILQMGPGRRP